MSKWSEWLHRQMTAKDVDQTTLAGAAGYNKSIVSNWLADKTGQPKLDSVRRTADALGVSVAEALVAAEYISADELQNSRLPADISAIDTADLLREVGARLGYDIKPSALQRSSPGLRLAPAWGDSSVPPPSRDELGVAADADRE